MDEMDTTELTPAIIESISKKTQHTRQTSHLHPPAEIMEIDDHAYEPDIILTEDDSAPTNSNASDILTVPETRNPWFGRGNNDVIVLSDSEDEVINANARVYNEEPVLYFLNDEVTLQLIKPPFGQLGSDVILLDDSAENSGEHSVESVASVIANSSASNEFKKEDSTVTFFEMNSQKACEKRECINSDCMSIETATFSEAPMFALNYFHVERNLQRRQFICQQCFDESVNDYERLCAALVNQHPLLLEQLPVRREIEVVEINDSEEEDNGSNGCSSNTYVDCSNSLSSETLALLEDHFEGVVNITMDRINIEQQTTWTNEILEHKLGMNEDISKSLDEEIHSLQKLSESMYKKLYKNSKFVIEELPPFDLNENKQLHMYGPDYPPRGELVYPTVDIDSLYYAVRTNLLSTWMPCKVTERVDSPADGKTMFHVRFLRCKDDLNKTVPGNNLAFGTSPSVRLSVGTRVIALLTNEPTNSSRLNFLPGVIAETLQAYNRWRYLIFFDDGYAQYVTPDNIRLICSPSLNVWEDVYPGAAAFIKSYLKQYKTERPMVHVIRGQRMITEWNKEWRNARVEDIDGSLVLMHFENVKRWEWIYRGSWRLGPMFKDRQQQRRSAIAAKRNEPFVEYDTIDDGEGSNCRASPPKPVQSEKLPLTQPVISVPSTMKDYGGDDDDDSNICRASPPKSVQPEKPRVTQPIAGVPWTLKEDDDSNVCRASSPKSVQPEEPPVSEPVINVPLTIQMVSSTEKESRSVGKKSVTKSSRPTVHRMNNATIYIDEDNRLKGRVVYYSVKKHIPPRKFVPHNCDVTCLHKEKCDLSSYSPLAKPLLSGWERRTLHVKTVKIKKVIVYRTPCGRTLRNMSELHKYLRATKCTLNVDNFDFSVMTSCLAEYVVDKRYIKNQDLSDGCEPMVVSCVNYYDNTMPPPCVYSAKRIPNEGVNLNLDPNFLCGCDCEDDCMDKTKCQCWKLTLEGAQLCNPDTPIDRLGYEFKRLPDVIQSGIYECNSQCKCSKTCLNRVVQHPLQIKLQVFKTVSRGWGLRCLNDVPKGCFICVYVGDILTDKNANIAGSNYGDEYFAELDYIEVVECLKAGYESEVIEDVNDDDDEYRADPEYVPSVSEISRQTRHYPVDGSNKKKIVESSKLKVEPSSSSDEEDSQRQLLSFLPDPNSVTPLRWNSIHKFYDKNETVFTIDAMKKGNIGRYFNHSCEPNLFVQNVFVDTHDLRFPWVAFFAKSHIRAGSELTWDYSYIVDSVPGKELFCECGARSCRGRIL